MSRIVESDFENPEVTVLLLKRTLHGGLIPEGEFSEEEVELCNSVEWIESATRFKCDCGSWHTTSGKQFECPIEMKPVDPSEVQEGYRRTSDISIQFGFDSEYNFKIVEHSSVPTISEIDDKTLIFSPDIEELEFPDRVGRVVWLPLSSLPEVTDNNHRGEIIQEIRDKRKELIDWNRLDSRGNDFEELSYRLISRDDQFYNPSWGGRGVDQGKDAFCSIDLASRETRVLVQAKYNPGSSLSRSDIRGYVQDTKEHDCTGLLLTTINTSGQAETSYESHGYQTDSVPFVRLWQGVEIKERLSGHPKLISEYFLHRDT